MRKLTLDPEMLRVESFAPGSEGKPAAGTVRGNSIITFNYNPCGGGNPTPDCEDTQWEVETCGWTCMNECLESGTAPCTQCV
jgi:hypothetical protein